MHKGIHSWHNLLLYAFNVFSIPLLLRTLFSPWKMDNTKGASYSFFEKLVFAILSRFIGFVSRLILISIGLVFCFFVLLSFPLFLFLPINISKESIQFLPSFGASLSYGNTFTLNKHGKDIFGSSEIKIFGKEKALRMIERGLLKDTNHNILLLGDRGVGKSTLISHIALLAQSGLSNDGIKHHRIVELFVEGIDIKDFEMCLEEASSSSNVILVINNIHLYKDLYEVLMPYLNAPNLGIIATSDFANYDSYLKNYPEFLSKFSKVDLAETNKEDTLEILKNSSRIEGISINEDALLEIVRLTDRLIGNQPQPIKSLAVLEELETLNKKITIDDVRQIVSDKTNMPIGAIGLDEKKILLELENKMKTKIIGQDEAVKDVSQALIRLRTGIADHNKPAASFLFLGSTGVGKTYTAKILAESYFGRKNAMIRFDMSEFSLPDSVNIFSDRVASAIEENPLSLVFFDELEKANKLIHNLMLQILDEGRLTRANGMESSFRDAIIIMTSNAGSHDIIENQEIKKNDLVDILIKKSIFAPEFLNRFSNIILFKPLSESHIRKVAELMLLELQGRLFEDKGINLNITDSLIDKISSVGFDKDFGARPIKRAIEQIVENKVAEHIISGSIEKEITIE